MRRITVVLGFLMAFGLAVMTDLAFSSWRDFWQTHSMLTGLVSSALLLGITVLIVDEQLDRRKARRSRRVALTAYRELSTAAFEAMVAIARAAEADPYDLDAYQQHVEAVLHGDEASVEFMLVMQEQSKVLSASVAQWAPVMLQHAELAEALDDFAGMRDALLEVPRVFFFGGREPGWEQRAAEAFESFMAAVALFHARRKGGARRDRSGGLDGLARALSRRGASRREPVPALAVGWVTVVHADGAIAVRGLPRRPLR